MALRILIVDDESAVRRMLAIAFTKAGYEVASARDASEAMSLMTSEKFDAVLSDVVMGSLSGHDLAR